MRHNADDFIFPLTSGHIHVMLWVFVVGMCALFYVIAPFLGIPALLGVPFGVVLGIFSTFLYTYFHFFSYNIVKRKRPSEINKAWWEICTFDD